MAQTGFFHHIGTFLLFAATILLIVTTISAPVVNNISLLKVTLGNATSSHDTAVTFGTFGDCIINTAADNHDFCSRREVGYSPALIMERLDRTSFSQNDVDATRVLTRVMILHPIATGISFFAFLLGIGAGVIGSFFASLVSLVAFLVTLVVLITDFVLFHIIKDHVNSRSDDATGSHANWGVAIWTLLAAAICLLLGTIVVFFSCCSARLHRQSARASKGDPAFAAAPRRRRWF